LKRSVYCVDMLSGYSMEVQILNTYDSYTLHICRNMREAILRY